jgi:hypothetical protein
MRNDGMNEPEQKTAQSSVLIVGVGAWRGLGAALARRFAADARTGCSIRTPSPLLTRCPTRPS